jgi:5-methylcytosine-specific restriction endonuclease McrBC GTP-binding regulatory subunit McrB
VVPSNLYITGTINIDETTQPLSDKVLDRAVVLQLQASSPGHYLDRLADDDSNLEDTVEDCREVLNRVHSILADEGLAFGYRVAEEFVRYVQFARENGGRSISSLIDDQMVQKVLPKLQGSHRQRPMLNDLEALFERRGLQRSSEQIEEMKEELSEIGSFQATR